jgi:hypothetical protein
MPLLSTSTQRPDLSGPRGAQFEPFTAFARFVPNKGFGRRLEAVRDLEKQAQFVEDELLLAGLNIATPVAFTPQFQAVPARFTIVGFVDVSVGSAAPDENAPPVTPTATVIHSGTAFGEATSVLTPPQGQQGHGDNPTAQNVTDVVNLKSSLEAASPGLDVFYIEYKGVKYGQQPNRSGFFGFNG